MKKYYVTLTLILLLSLAIGASYAQPVTEQVAFQTGPGTAFTYQGRLTAGDVAVNGTYDFLFRLYDAASEGTRLGINSKGDIAVTDGLFTVELDFGDAVFDGEPRWLEVGVRPGSSTGAYEILEPRQRITPTPYAILAAHAPWSGLLDVPAGFADGVDDGSHYQNVVVVAKSGGDQTSIQAALDSITDASADNPYLIWVAPGVYSERVTMKAHVDIQGAGEAMTKITYEGNPTQDKGTVAGANDAELRFLTVENSGGEGYAIGIYNSAVSPELMHVTVSALGASENNLGVYNLNGSSPLMKHVTVFVRGGINSYGVVNESNSTPIMTSIIISATAGTEVVAGVANDASSPTMTDITVTASTSNGSSCYGVINDRGSAPIMTNITASAWGANNLNIGVMNRDNSPATLNNVHAFGQGGPHTSGVSNRNSSATIRHSTLSAAGGEASYGLENMRAEEDPGSSSYIVTVDHCQLAGVYAVYSNEEAFTIRIGASLLDGGVRNEGGTVVCAGVYDENYKFYPDSCPYVTNTLSWRVIGGGGATSVTSESYTLGSTIGQPAADLLTSDDYTLSGGFWSAAR